MKKLSSKNLDRLIERIYYANCNGVQLNILDIPKVFRAGEQAYAAGADENGIKDAILAKVAEVRVN
jgi:hypothetical protein